MASCWYRSISILVLYHYLILLYYWFLEHLYYLGSCSRFVVVYTKRSIRGLSITGIFSYVVFICLNFMNILICNFDISDGIYGSVFFMLTGFHWISCIFRSFCMILVSLLRSFFKKYVYMNTI